MMNSDQIDRAKKLLEGKGYTVQEPWDLDDEDVVSLNEFVSTHKDKYVWEETLEEALATEEDFSPRGDQDRVFELGDIIMARGVYSTESQSEVSAPHRILVITSKKEDSSGLIKYKGFLLSSNVRNANKNKGWKYPNNIYINDYATILERGVPQHKEALIQVGGIIEFDNRSISSSGTWKGRASEEFLDFVRECYRNRRRGISNKEVYWEK